MKMENDNLDTLLKSKLNEGGIPFKESYWEAARGIINAKRTKSKRIYWLFLPALCFVAALFIYTEESFLSNSNIKKTDKNTLALNSTLKANQIEYAGLVNQNEKSINQKENKKEELTNENSSSKNKPENRKTLTTKGSKKEISNKGGVFNQSDILNLDENESNKEESNNFSSQNDFNESNLFAKKTEFNQPITIQSYLFKGFKIKQKNLEKTNELALINPNKKRKFLHSYTSFNLGLQTNNNLRPSYQVNLLWHYVASQQLSFYTGLGMFQTSPELRKRTYNETSYSFGESNKSISIDTRKLYYLNIPLGLEFKIKGRHEFSSGLNYLYLLSSKDEFYYYNNGLLIDNKTKDSHISLFNQSDVLVELNYAFWMNTKSKISIGYYHGLRNITESKMFESADKNRNKGMRLGIQYNLN